MLRLRSVEARYCKPNDELKAASTSRRVVSEASKVSSRGSPVMRVSACTAFGAAVSAAITKITSETNFIFGAVIMRDHDDVAAIHISKFCVNRISCHEP